MTAPEAPEPRSSVTRLQIGVIVAVILLAATIGVVFGLTVMEGRASTLAPAAGYVPSGAVMYMEADLSLAPGQQDALQAILARFPGDKDEMIGDALAQTLDDELAKDDAPFTYSKDIAPWFEGTVAVTVLDVPFDMQEPRPPATAALVAVTDAAGATEFADMLRGTMDEEGTSFTSSEAHGFTVWTAEPADPGADAPEFMAESGFAYAVTDDQIVMANSRATVEALLAVNDGGDSLADRTDVRDLAAHLPSEAAGVITLNVRATLDAMREQMGAADPTMTDLLEQSMASVPDMVVASLSFEADAILVDGATSLPTGDVVPSNSRRTLAASVPSDAIFFADASNVGASASAGLARLRDQLDSGEASGELEELQQIEAALGGQLDELFSWVGGGAVAAGWDGDQPYAGLVLEVTDSEAADDRLRQLQNLLSLATMDPSAEVQVTTETVAGVEVTSIRFSTMTPMGSDAAETEAVIQYALDGERLLIGVGDRFVSRALQLAADESLADDPRYAAAIDRFGGDDNAGAFYLDVATLRETLESQAGEMLPPEYATQMLPYLEPLDLVAGVTRVEDGAAVTGYGLVLR
jgi:hypothetical protein